MPHSIPTLSFYANKKAASGWCRVAPPLRPESTSPKYVVGLRGNSGLPNHIADAHGIHEADFFSFFLSAMHRRATRPPDRNAYRQQ